MKRRTSCGDYVNRAVLWSDAKSRWCCEKEQVGCAGESASGWSPFSLQMIRHSNSGSSSQPNHDHSYWSHLPSDRQLVQPPSDKQLVRPLSNKFLLWRPPRMDRWLQAIPLAPLVGLSLLSVATLVAVVVGRCRSARTMKVADRTRSLCSTTARRRVAQYRPVSSSETSAHRGLLDTWASSNLLKTF